eukprot:TRINITY_DN1794_c0_g3_i3.p1 TRINITY_DN1794_c0_g3~~TRINITY_DN1794_c0_g3_i3.p1  ORF type:complete len:826 (-),score=244.31 TRINITY_DN1794_c0_g3_i3:340-2817(-)
MALEQLLPTINRLQDVFTTLGVEPIDLPQIVVVGSQSSGKSSVLENIVGKDFLPRGSGIVTRRPLILQLCNIRRPAVSQSPPPAQSQSPPPAQSQAVPSRSVSQPVQPPRPTAASAAMGAAFVLSPATAVAQPVASIKELAKGDEWGEFVHKPHQKFYNFNEIRDEIVAETDRLTGKNKGISGYPIRLKIFSPYVVNLTLVDLPGITRIPVGDQPSDIEVQVKKMVLEFISKPNAIILAVTAANVDVSTSDALQMARQVDPQGVRTLGVISKLDLMDKGTNALELLTGKSIPLSLGYIGVVNRSQEDINTGKTIRQAVDDESKFFNSHPMYRQIAKRHGTQHLAQTLNKVLLQHIKETLPDLRLKVNKLLVDARADAAQFGDDLIGENANKGAFLLQLITRFCNEFCNTIDGKANTLTHKELTGGARISYIFNEIFSEHLFGMDPLTGLTVEDLRTVIRNTTGSKASLFIPEESFEILVKQQVAKLEKPALECSELVYEELQRIVMQIEERLLSRFLGLQSAVGDCVGALLAANKEPAQEMIKNLIKIELGFLNTSHPDFTGSAAIVNVIQGMVAEKSSIRNGSPEANNANSSPATMNELNDFKVLPKPQPTKQQPQREQQPQPPLPKKGQAQHVAPPVVPPQPPVTVTSSHCPVCNEVISGDWEAINQHIDQCLKSQPQQQTRQTPQQQQQQQQSGLLASFFGRGDQHHSKSAHGAPSPAAAPITSPTPGGPYYGSAAATGKKTPPPPATTTPTPATTQPQVQQPRQAPLQSRRDGMLLSIPETLVPGYVTERDRFETDLIKSLLQSYFEIVRKNIVDTVPKVT